MVEVIQWTLQSSLISADNPNLLTATCTKARVNELWSFINDYYLSFLIMLSVFCRKCKFINEKIMHLLSLANRSLFLLTVPTATYIGTEWWTLISYKIIFVECRLIPSYSKCTLNISGECSGSYWRWLIQQSNLSKWSCLLDLMYYIITKTCWKSEGSCRH